MPQSLWKNKTLAVLGGGNMAEAIVKGAIASGVIGPGQAAVYDPLPARRDIFAGLGCRVYEDAKALPVEEADAILLATKPQIVPEALTELTIPAGKLMISIAAGIAAKTLEQALPAGTRVVRVMPNTPLLVGAGMSALAKGSRARDDDLGLATELFASAGQAVQVDESLMDAVTALSGSGPAYVFRMAEALTEGGVKLGLDREMAKELAIATLCGAAEMLRQNDDAALLRERVTSPGGTTAAAIRVMDEGGFMPLIAAAMTAARDRSRELGRPK